MTPAGGNSSRAVIEALALTQLAAKVLAEAVRLAERRAPAARSGTLHQTAVDQIVAQFGAELERQRALHAAPGAPGGAA